MAKKSKPFVLRVAENPNPTYPSMQAALEAAVPLLAELIRIGAAKRGVHPLTGLPIHPQPTPDEAEAGGKAR